MFRAFLFPVLTCSLLAQSGAEILAKVDRLRRPWPSFSVEVSIREGSALAQRWKVLARSNGDVRVEGVSEKEKGRVVLMLGEQMWLLLPTAAKPIKVTPQQRLLGAAASGDIARSSLAEDYDVVKQAEAALDDVECLRLELRAKRPSTSFRKAYLWVDSRTNRPIKVEYYLASGKLSKVAHFPAPVNVHGSQALPWMSLAEPGGKQVELRFEKWAPRTHNPELFQLPGAN